MTGTRPPEPAHKRLADEYTGKCPDTGLSIPECCCTRCLVALMNQHAPPHIREQINALS